MRIKMPVGHQQLCLEGTLFNPDPEGCFDVPDSHAQSLIDVHGASRAPSLDELQATIDAIDARRETLEGQLKALDAEKTQATAAYDIAKARQQEAVKAALAAQVDATKPPETKPPRTLVTGSAKAGKGGG